MPGKQPRALCPVCQEAMPPDETECRNCGAFVIDEAVVRLCRAFGIDRAKALQLFEAGFRHPKQIRDRDPDGVLRRRESGLLFLCTNCGGFVAGGDRKCQRCGVEFEGTPDDELKPRDVEQDILDLLLCTNCGADNGPGWTECEICGEPLPGAQPPATPKETPSPAPPPPVAPEPPPDEEDQLHRIFEDLDVALTPSAEEEDVEAQEEPPAPPPMPTPEPMAPVGEVEREEDTSPEGIPGPKPTETDLESLLPDAAGSEPQEAAMEFEPRAPSAPEVPEPGVPEASCRTVRRPAEIRVRGPGPKSPARVADRARKGSASVLVGPAVAGAALSLYVANALGQDWTMWGIAFLLAILSGYALSGSYPSQGVRLSRLDVVLLGSGAGLECLAPILYAASPGLPPEPGSLLAVSGAIPLAAAARRLLRAPGRTLLAAAGGIPLIALATTAAYGLPFAGTSAWTLGLLAAVPWPVILTLVEARERIVAGALRRDLERAERGFARQDFSKSVEDYDRAIRLTEKGAGTEDLPWYGKGAALVILGRYEEALRAIDQALDINPHNEVAWVNKGNAFTKMGRLVDAMRCFNAAIRVNPAYEVAWNNKGNALARMGRYEEALRCYDKALEIDPEYRGAWVNKGYVLSKLGRYEEAATCADRVIGLRGAGRTDETARSRIRESSHSIN